MNQPSLYGGWFFFYLTGFDAVKQQLTKVFGIQGQSNVDRSIHHYLLCGFAVIGMSVVIGCSNSGPVPINPKKVIPVTGIIHVDGAPTLGVKVKLAPDPMPADNKITLVTNGKTDAEGKFALTTYYQNDGAPIGDFSLLFQLDLNPAGSTVDKFQGKYWNPHAAEHKLSVKGDEESIDMGVIELTTQ